MEEETNAFRANASQEDVRRLAADLLEQGIGWRLLVRRYAELSSVVAVARELGWSPRSVRRVLDQLGISTACPHPAQREAGRLLETIAAIEGCVRRHQLPTCPRDGREMEARRRWIMTSAPFAQLPAVQAVHDRLLQLVAAAGMRRLEFEVAYVSDCLDEARVASASDDMVGRAAGFNLLRHIVLRLDNLALAAALGEWQVPGMAYKPPPGRLPAERSSPPTGWLTRRQATERVGITSDQVRTLVRGGHLELGLFDYFGQPVEEGSELDEAGAAWWFISAQSVERLGRLDSIPEGYGTHRERHAMRWLGLPTKRAGWLPEHLRRPRIKEGSDGA